MRSRNIIFVFLFSLFITLYYLTLISSQLPDFQAALEFRSTSGIPIYLSVLQHWTFNIISLLCDSIIVAIAVGIVGYFIKELKLYWALLFGFVSRYLIILILFLYSIIRSSLPTGAFTKNLTSELYILLLLQLIFTLYFSYFGFNYGRQIEYYDSKDKELYYLYGIPKKILALLLISYNPVIQFLSQLTIVQVYEVTKKMTSMSFWKDTFSLSNILSDDSARGIAGLFGHIMVICFAWVIAIALLFFGLNAIRNRDTRHRWLKITSVFILFPAMLLIIPVIRNRTWFF